MIGSFPPPIGGASMVNLLVHDALVGVGVAVTRADVSGPRLAHSRGLGYHVRRLVRNLSAARKARRASARTRTLYIVPDAGLGAWYTLGHIVVLGRRFDQIVIHHHSCRYIEEHSRPIAAIVRRTSHKATHVFLTLGMANAFRHRYGPVACHVATNARFVAEETQRPPDGQPNVRLRIGHLSNLCVDKGFFEVANTFDALRAAGHDAELVLAGPILEPEVEERLAIMHATHGVRIRYLGALSGDAKRNFYREIELFLFPTRFRQEAAPLVIYEALAAGVPVLSTDRGVIAEIIPTVGGGVCPRDADFTSFVLAAIANWNWHPGAVLAREKAIKDAMAQAVDGSIVEYNSLIALLAGDKVSTVRVASS